MSGYTEELVEAVKANIDYIESETIEDFLTFLEAVGESVYEGEMLESLARVVRDVLDGVR